MVLYRYIALDQDGKKLNGLLDADSLESAKERLRSKEVIVTKIDQAKDRQNTAIGTNLRINFTRDLSQLLRAKLPLFESLATIEEKYRSHKHHFLFLDFCDKVRGGKKLSQVLREYPNSFDQVYISMVEAGENTGELELAFLQLFKVISRNDKCKKQATSALIYPLFLLGFCGIILLGLFFFLIPSMNELFEGRQLHPMTQAVLGLSNWLRGNWIGLLSVTVVSITAAIFALRTKSAVNYIKHLTLKIPLLGAIITEAILMRFCRVLSILLSSGVPIVEALRFAKGVIHHPDFEAVIRSVEKGLIKGRKFSMELRQFSIVPPLMVRMIETSEETGNTSEMLMNISEIYEEKLEKTISQFTNLLQPVMLLVLGVIVGVVLLSVLLPLTDMSTLM